jgi:histidine triad (HIT) family protein
MSTIFSKIINGEISCHKIAENDKFLAFLDISPLAKGHTLVIPKVETNYIFDVEDNEYADLWLFAKEVAKKVKAKIDCTRIGIAVLGLEVAHAHIHLVPINNVSDIDFSREKLKLTQDELAVIAAKINE